MKRLLAALGLLGALAASILYFVRTQNAPLIATPSNAQAAGEAVPVTVAEVERGVMRQSISLIGVLRADRQVAISAKVPGRILDILVRDGDPVRSGQLLVRLDIGEAQAQVSGAAAGVAAAQAQYRKAVEGKKALEVELDAKIAEADAGLRTALAKLRQAELGVRLTKSTATSDTERAKAAVQQAEAGVQQAEVGLKQAEELVERLEFLFKRGGVARVDLEGARAQADIARAQRDSAVAALAQAKAAARPAAESEPLRGQVSEADVQAAQAGVQQARQGLESARRAKAEALRLADRDIEAARAQLAQARAGRTQASAMVGNGLLTSPLEGLVTNRLVNVGEFAQPGMPLMTVIAPDSAYLEVAVPIRYAGQLRPGLPARVTVDTLPDRPFDGEVARILPISATDTRSLPARIRLRTAGVRLLPGATARAVVELSRQENALLIPVDALRQEGNTAYVFVAAGGRAQRRDVTTGAVEGQSVQVLSGLSAGEKVILSGPTLLQSGMAVRVEER